MPDVILPFPEEGKNDKETIQNLIDVMIKYRKELEFLLTNLDEQNVLVAKRAQISDLLAGYIRADQIDVTEGKIQAAQIENLVVGSNVTMGPNATISWSKVTDQPNIGQIALNTINSTYIDGNGVWTPNVYATNIVTLNGKITTAQIEDLVVGSNVTMGPNATISWSKIDNKPTDIVYDSDLSSALSNYVTSGTLSSTLMSYVTSTALTTTLGQDYVITGKILANQVTAGTLTGFTIQTGVSGNNRLVMNPSGIISYNSSNQKSGIVVENGTYGYGALDFYHNSVKVGSIYYDTFGGMHIGPYGGATIYADGAWNFVGATVTGLTATAKFG